MTLARPMIEGIKVTRLERQCRRLLSAYPAGYRAERGEEIVDTLMEANADRTRLPIRDSIALFVGGLAVRSTENRRLPMLANLRLAVLFGLVLLVAPIQLRFIAFRWYYPEGGHTSWPELIAAAGGLAAVTLVWTARRNLTAMAAAVGVAGSVLTATVVDMQWPHPLLAQMPWIVAVSAIALLARGPARLPRVWIWLVLGYSLRFVLPYEWHAQVPSLLAIVGVLPLVAMLAWIVIDARPAIGLTFCLAAMVATDEGLMRLQGGSESSFEYLPLLIAAALLIPALFRIRQQQAL